MQIQIPTKPAATSARMQRLPQGPSPAASTLGTLTRILDDLGMEHVAAIDEGTYGLERALDHKLMAPAITLLKEVKVKLLILLGLFDSWTPPRIVEETAPDGAVEWTLHPTRLRPRPVLKLRRPALGADASVGHLELWLHSTKIAVLDVSVREVPALVNLILVGEHFSEVLP